MFGCVVGINEDYSDLTGADRKDQAILQVPCQSGEICTSIRTMSHGEMIPGRTDNENNKEGKNDNKEADTDNSVSRKKKVQVYRYSNRHLFPVRRG